MKKLTDVYIKVTKDNANELRILLQLPKYNFHIDTKIVFSYEDLNSWQIRLNDVLGCRKKVSLAELKILIDTIPTREEINRLKAQISAYKMNLGNCKHEIQMARNTINQLHKDLDLSINKKSESSVNNLNLIDITTIEIELLKQQNNGLSKMYDDLVISKFENLRNFNKVTEDLSEKNFQLRKENAKLKQRKWWQIWK